MAAIEVIFNKDPLYTKSLSMRHEVLRAPLGMRYTPEELEFDNGVTYIIYVVDGEVLGVVGMVPGEKARLLQMAVSEKLHGQGIGRKLVAALEEYAKSQGCIEVYLNARLNARGFYKKLGYTEYGAEYIKIGIPHIDMKKSL